MVVTPTAVVIAELQTKHPPALATENLQQQSGAQLTPIPPSLPVTEEDVLSAIQSMPPGLAAVLMGSDFSTSDS